MTDRQPIIATWLVADTPADRTDYPQVPGDSATIGFQAVYWRCVVCFFATAVKMQVPARRVLFTNVETVPSVDGYDLGKALIEPWRRSHPRTDHPPAAQVGGSILGQPVLHPRHY